MEHPLKQRLIGAAVLVALAVIVLPTLVDMPTPDSTPAETLPLDIPAPPAAGLQTREISLQLPAPASAGGVGGQVPPANGMAGQASGESEPVVTVDTADSAPAPRVDALVYGAATTPSVTNDAAVAADRDRAPAAAPPPANSTPKPAVATAPPAAQPAAPEPPAATAATAASGRFVVTLGSFANAANAEALRARVQARGVAVLVDRPTVNGSEVTRLRAGPYPSRARAEAAALEIGRAEPGNRFVVGELDAAQPLAAGAGGQRAAAFAVQVGALRQESEATQLRDRLRAAGFAAFVAQAETDAGVLWRVRVGPELDRSRAEMLRGRLKQQLQLDGMLVNHP